MDFPGLLLKFPDAIKGDNKLGRTHLNLSENH
jgi:hypothetical protein